ncbi:hypothetical protein KLP28_01160 [Nocardioidaceae bacterium]|nr:hypothetical protein KLP28_01160 [Nocardioidaceae bacterium]
MVTALMLLLATMTGVVVLASLVLLVVAAPHTGGRLMRVPGVRGASQLLHR